MLNEIINLIRVRQWYKNLLVFIALIFAGKALNYSDLSAVLLAFVSLCAVSSAVYIFNDIIDKEKDKQHSEKKNRPIASGKISVKTGALLSGLLLAIGFGISFLLPSNFTLLLVVIIAINLLYSFWLQRILFVDVITIAFLLLLRAIAGGFAINVSISSWLLLCTFILALFLALAKRKSDLLNYKAQYDQEGYSENLLNSLLLVCIAVLLTSYAIYTFFTHLQSYFFALTLPIAFFLAFRFYYLITINHEAAKKAEDVFYDKQMLAGMAVWLILIALGIYLR